MGELRHPEAQSGAHYHFDCSAGFPGALAWTHTSNLEAKIEPGRGERKEQNRLILTMLKITVLILPSVWGATDNFLMRFLLQAGLPPCRRSTPGQPMGLWGIDIPGPQYPICADTAPAAQAASKRTPDPKEGLESSEGGIFMEQMGRLRPGKQGNCSR
jgi:hypothetical protein